MLIVNVLGVYFSKISHFQSLSFQKVSLLSLGLYSCVFIIHCCSLASRENPHWNHRPRCRRRRCFVSIVVLSTLATIPFLVFGIFPIVFEVARFVLLNPTCLACLCGRPLTHRCKKRKRNAEKPRREQTQTQDRGKIQSRKRSIRMVNEW